MTTANKITIARILLVPFFIVQMLYYINFGNEGYRLSAILAFALAALTDGVDGYIARHYNQRSELGAILDPLADKLLLVSGIVLLTFNTQGRFEQIPLWLTGTIVGRDAILLLGLLVIYYTSGQVNVRPRISGKIATVLQMATVLWILFRWDRDFVPVLTIGAALFTAASGLLYLWDGMRQLSASPASAPSPTQNR